jgi:hypothetical protein
VVKVATAQPRGPLEKPRQRRPPLKVVQKQAPRRRVTRPVVIFLIVAVALLGGVAGHILLERTTMEETALANALAQAEVKHNELMLKRAELESPQRITRYAETHLGLVFPPSLNVVSGSLPHGSTPLPQSVPANPDVPRQAGAQ